jgi:hypothetical protein
MLWVSQLLRTLKLNVVDFNKPVFWNSNVYLQPTGNRVASAVWTTLRSHKEVPRIDRPPPPKVSFELQFYPLL